jgi:hypothetical protein
MATNNPTWGEERIADELLLKIGVRISPRTESGYSIRDVMGGRPTPLQHTPVRNIAAESAALPVGSKK